MNLYITSVRLKNFQSHHDSSFELSPGLNIIVGPSDQGKSAIIRALRWVMYNEPRGAAFIRTGETRTEVKVVLSNGTVVERIRDESGKVNRYLLEIPGEEPQVFERFNKEVPLEIRKAFGISKLVVDRDRSLEINLARQLEGPFLMEESGGTRSKVLGRVANLHIIDAAQRDVLRDVNLFSQEAGRLDGEIKEIEDQLEVYADLESAAVKLTNLESMMHLISGMEDNYNLLIDFKNKMESTKAQMDDTLEQLKILDKLDQVLEITNDIQDKHALLNELESLAKGFESSQDGINSCLAVVRQTENVPEVENILERLRSLREEGYILQQARRTYQEIIIDARQKEAELKEAEAISKKVADVDNAEDVRTMLGRHIELLHKLTELKNDYDAAKVRFVKMDEDYTKHDQLVLKLSIEYGDSLSEAGRCPVCFAEISPETVERIKKELA